MLCEFSQLPWEKKKNHAKRQAIMKTTKTCWSYKKSFEQAAQNMNSQDYLWETSLPGKKYNKILF